MLSESLYVKAEEKKKILLVDDDCDYLFQQKLFLEENNYEVITADNKKEALEKIKDHSSKLSMAIIDLMMEEMDTGLVLAYEIKNDHPHLPVLMMTAVSMKTGIQFEKQGPGQEWIYADRLMSKPVRPEQLLGEIKKLLKE